MERRQNDRNSANRPTAGEEIRCDCGSLLARLIENALEFKCRRCKRTIVFPLARLGADWTELGGEDQNDER